MAGTRHLAAFPPELDLVLAVRTLALAHDECRIPLSMQMLHEHHVASDFSESDDAMIRVCKLSVSHKMLLIRLELVSVTQLACIHTETASWSLGMYGSRSDESKD